MAAWGKALQQGLTYERAAAGDVLLLPLPCKYAAQGIPGQNAAESDAVGALIKGLLRSPCGTHSSASWLAASASHCTSQAHCMHHVSPSSQHQQRVTEHWSKSRLRNSLLMVQAPALAVKQSCMP